MLPTVSKFIKTDCVVVMLPDREAVELPEKVQTVELVSVWRGLTVRRSCAWLCSIEAKESKAVVTKTPRDNGLRFRDAGGGGGGFS